MLALVGYKSWLPINLSSHGAKIDLLIDLVHWFMAILFVVWGIYFIYCLVRFRERPGHEASTKHPKAKISKYGEIGVVVVEIVLLGFFSIPFWGEVRGASYARELDDPLELRVVAEQFAWNIHYPGEDGKFGPTKFELIAKENPIGLDRDEVDAKDDIVTLNQLYVPVNRDIIIHITSKDVIHSFNLPYLRVKQDAVPGMSIPVWFRAIKTTAEAQTEMTRTYPTRPNMIHLLKNHIAMREYKSTDNSIILNQGDLISTETLTALARAGIDQIEASPEVPTEIACAQLCGLTHYRMRGYMHIEEKEEFEARMAEEASYLEEDEDDY